MRYSYHQRVSSHLEALVEIACNLPVLVIGEVQRLKRMFPFFDGWVFFARFEERFVLRLAVICIR